eukprot:jgi/Undpi1/13436/HiC_scaffold_8.g03095.m1
MAPVSTALSSLKRLVETHLREKDHATDMLKGYVTTITREVAMITRQYINGLLLPGRGGGGAAPGGRVGADDSPGVAPAFDAAPPTTSAPAAAATATATASAATLAMMAPAGAVPAVGTGVGVTAPIVVNSIPPEEEDLKAGERERERGGGGGGGEEGGGVSG